MAVPSSGCILGGHSSGCLCHQGAARTLIRRIICVPCQGATRLVDETLPASYTLDSESPRPTAAERTRLLDCVVRSLVAVVPASLSVTIRVGTVSAAGSKHRDCSCLLPGPVPVNAGSVLRVHCHCGTSTEPEPGTQGPPRHWQAGTAVTALRLPLALTASGPVPVAVPVVTRTRTASASTSASGSESSPPPRRLGAEFNLKFTQC